MYFLFLTKNLFRTKCSTFTYYECFSIQAFRTVIGFQTVNQSEVKEQECELNYVKKTTLSNCFIHKAKNSSKIYKFSSLIRLERWQIVVKDENLFRCSDLLIALSYPGHYNITILSVAVLSLLSRWVDLMFLMTCRQQSPNQNRSCSPLGCE